MAALRMFFKNNRESIRRINKAYDDMLERLENPQPVENVNTFEEEFLQFDTVLRTGTFLEDYDIVDFVWEASEKAFVKIMENLHTYPENIRNVLIYNFNPPTISKKKATELTEDDMDQMNMKHLKELSLKVEDAWQNYKKKYGLTRPDGEVDGKYTDLYEALQKKKKELDEKKATKKYVAPSMRDKVSPEVKLIQDQISKLENEIEQVKKEIELEEQVWENGKKSELYGELLFEVL